MEEKGIKMEEKEMEEKQGGKNEAHRNDVEVKTRLVIRLSPRLELRDDFL